MSHLYTVCGGCVVRDTNHSPDVSICSGPGQEHPEYLFLLCTTNTNDAVIFVTGGVLVNISQMIRGP